MWWDWIAAAVSLVVIGYGISRLVGHMYMTLEGIFGVPGDVSFSLIILFTIYGAFLQLSGAGRAIVLSSFLLGGPSGRGWPPR